MSDCNKVAILKAIVPLVAAITAADASVLFKTVKRGSPLYLTLDQGEKPAAFVLGLDDAVEGPQYAEDIYALWRVGIHVTIDRPNTQDKFTDLASHDELLWDAEARVRDALEFQEGLSVAGRVTWWRTLTPLQNQALTPGSIMPVFNVPIIAARTDSFP